MGVFYPKYMRITLGIFSETPKGIQKNVNDLEVF